MTAQNYAKSHFLKIWSYNNLPLNTQYQLLYRSHDVTDFVVVNLSSMGWLGNADQIYDLDSVFYTAFFKERGGGGGGCPWSP